MNRMLVVVACFALSIGAFLSDIRMMASVVQRQALQVIHQEEIMLLLSSEKRNDGIMSLQELTNNPLPGTLQCPPPLVPIYNKVVHEPLLRHNNNQTRPRNIPRSIHVSHVSRCLPPDLAHGIDLWQAALPRHSFYFHDDAAVAKLLQSEWPEFPELHDMMHCVKYKGAMTIDIWRILVIYRYGGIYTDIDNFPGPELTEDAPIDLDDQAFFPSDCYHRPTQWFFAMEPRHPIANLTMHEILKRLYNLPNVARPKVVFTTGPDALRHGYGAFLDWLPDKETIFVKGGFFRGKDNKTVHKVDLNNMPRYVSSGMNGTMNDIVPYDSTTNMTRRERIANQSGITYWVDEVGRKSEIEEISCRAILDRLSNETAAKKE